MLWYQLYQAEFGVDLTSQFEAWEMQLNRVHKIDKAEIFAAIRALKAQDMQDQRWKTRRPGISDVIKQIGNARRQKAIAARDQGEGRDCLITFIQTKLAAVATPAPAWTDDRIFSSVIDASKKLGAYRNPTSDEIRVVFHWAETAIGFDEENARRIIGKDVAPFYRELKEGCEKLSEAWVKGDSA